MRKIQRLQIIITRLILLHRCMHEARGTGGGGGGRWGGGGREVA